MHPILRLHMATEIVKAVMKFHEDKRLIHGDINAGNILLDLFKHKAGIVDFADVMSPNTSRRIRGNPIYFDSDLRNHLLRQGRVREAHLPTYHAVGHFTFKSDSYAVAIVVSQLMIMFMYPEQNIPETWDINDTHVLPDLDDIWEGKPRAYFDKVLTAIHEMTNESRQKRPTLKVFLEKLEAIKQQYITDTDFSLDTSLFDVDYYLSLSDEEQSKMLKDVACRHEVVLVDTKKNLLAKYFANKHKDSNTETKLERELLTYLTIKRKLETLKPNSLINLRVSDEWIAPTGDFDLYSGKLVEANRLIDENIEKIAKAYLNERQSIPFKMSWERKQSLSDLYNTEMQKMDASFKCC
jgi:serine/threonine protein kinase